MQFEAGVHFNEIVSPAIDEYLAAEDALTAAAVSGDGLDAAKYKALRLGAAAAIFLHHFSDVIAHRPPENLPDCLFLTSHRRTSSSRALINSACWERDTPLISQNIFKCS